MAERNAAFFGLYEITFFVNREELGEKRALELMGKYLEAGLKKSYDSAGPPFQKGNPQDFARVVKARDEGVGLRVEFPEVTERRIVYQFHTDPFPGLKGKVEAGKLDATYMAFKVRYLLGEGWSYTTTKHKWRGDGFTEHVIERKA